MASLPSAWLNAGSRPPAIYALLDRGIVKLCPNVLRDCCLPKEMILLEQLFAAFASTIVQRFRDEFAERLSLGFKSVKGGARRMREVGRDGCSEFGDDGVVVRRLGVTDVYSYATCGRCDGFPIGWLGSQKLFDHVCIAQPLPTPESEADFWKAFGRPAPYLCDGIDTVLATIVASTGADRRALILLVDEGALRLSLLPADSRAGQRLSLEARDKLAAHSDFGHHAQASLSERVRRRRRD